MIWGKVLGFFKGIPDIVWWILLAIGAGTYIDLRARGEQRAKDKARQAEEARKVDQRITENSDEMVAQADRIRAANPVPADAGELPDATLPSQHYRD